MRTARSSKTKQNKINYWSKGEPPLNTSARRNKPNQVIPDNTSQGITDTRVRKQRNDVRLGSTAKPEMEQEAALHSPPDPPQEQSKSMEALEAEN